MSPGNSEKAPFRITSAIPGRVRIRFARPYSRPERLDACARRLTGLPGTPEIEVVPDAASLIIRYDARRRDPAASLRQVVEAIAESVRALAPDAMPRDGGTAQPAVSAPPTPRAERNGALIPLAHSLADSVPARIV